MSGKEYSLREQNIIKKLNQVNNILEGQNIKIQYSVYNYNGIASKLEKSALYDTDVTSSVFSRTHVCNAGCMIDNVVKSCNIQDDIVIEENFNTNISDIENASVEELVAFFGNLDNHNLSGIGENKQYKISYKGVNGVGQDVEIKATYGKNYNYDIRTSVTQINNDGTISKVYFDKKASCDANYGVVEKLVTQGLETKNPESYAVLEKNIDKNGNNSFKINCLGNQKTNFSITASDDNFKNINSISFGGNNINYYEYQGKVENASGKLVCRIDTENGTIVKPNFSSANNIATASKITDEYYKKYKNYPSIKFDKKASKFIVEGSENAINSLNFETVLENAKNNFGTGNNDDVRIEFKQCQKEKRYIKKK